MTFSPDLPGLPAVRPLTAADLPAAKAVIDATGLFPSAMLDEMAAGYLSGDAPDDRWLVIDDGIVAGIGYCAPERMTSGTWNLYLIAVLPDRQRRGYGAAMVAGVEEMLRRRDGRILLVETSGLEEFAATRSFYRARGFDEEARIREFYQAGEDKIVFRKAL